MKVIDLLNKIANGEEVPKKVILDKKEFQYNKTYEQYLDKYEVNLLEHISDYNYSGLNDEVEIIEEDKEIEEIKDKLDVSTCGIADGEEKTNELIDKINELVKAVNELKKGK